MADVRKLFELQDQLKAVRESVRDRAATLRGELAEADNSVKTYMLENGLEICNYQGQRLQLALNERPMPLTRAAIAEGLRKHLSEADAEKCMQDIQAAAGTKRVATLRRARRAAARTPRPAAARASCAPRAPRAVPQADGGPAQANFEAPPLLDSDSD